MRKEVEPGGKNNLRGVSLLKGLDETTIKRLEEISGWYWYPEGEVIFDRTDPGSEVYLIVEGSVRIVGHAKSGQEVAFVDLHSGQYFGELSAIDGQARSATLYTLEDSVVAMVPADAFMEFLEANPDVSLRLMRFLVSTVRTLNSRVVGLSSTTVIQRVMSELLQMAEPDPSNPNEWIINHMPHHREVAVWVGTTPETVAEAIGQLFKEKVAKRQYKKLHILDRQRMLEMISAS